MRGHMRPLGLSRRAFLGALAALPACGFVGGGAAPKVAEKTEAGHGAAADEHADVSKLWAESGGDDLLHGKTFQGLFNGLANRQKAFEPKDNYLRCIDEGCPGGVHMAGSGVLNPNWEADLKGKVSGVYSHEGCGAVGLYIQAQKIKTDDPNAVADAEAKKIADKLGVPYLGRIKASQMTRPAAIHTARAVYYDGTGRLDAAQLAGLPQGFHVSRKIFSDPGQAKAEVDVSIGIAFGDHGFGGHFTGKSPFYLVAVSGLDPESVPLATLVNELKEVAGKIENVEIHTLIAKPEAAGDPAKTVVKAANPAFAPTKVAAKDSHAPDAKDSHAPAKAGAKAAPVVPKDLVPTFGPTYVISNRVVNLADPSGGRFLRFSAALEFAEKEAAHASVGGNQLALYVPEADAAEYREVTGGKVDPEKDFLARVKKYVPAIEDAVVSTLSARTSAELSRNEGKEAAKKEIAIRVQRLLGSAERITNVYFTEFVIQ
jgi:hypothetical protein